MSERFKYCLSSGLILIAFAAYSQKPNQVNQAVVTIVGDAPEELNNFNPYSENNEPQVQQQLSAQNIDPTLENGFHIRFELNSSQQEYNLHSADRTALVGGASTSSATPSYSGGGSSLGKSKKHGTNLAEHSFNTKKRVKSWLPKRKKRYRPHLCGRF